MSFLQNRDVCFNQESLPITYYNFHHKSLVRPKSKSPNWQGSQPISYKTNFSQKESMHLIDIKFKITYQNNQGELQVRPLTFNVICKEVHLFFHKQPVFKQFAGLSPFSLHNNKNYILKWRSSFVLNVK